MTNPKRSDLREPSWVFDPRPVYDVRTAAEPELEPVPEPETELLELSVADYVVFLFALDTFMRYQEETQGSVNPTDPVMTRGLALLRRAEQTNLDAMATFLKSNLGNPAQVKVLEAALRPPPTPDGAALRAQKLKQVLSRGGATTTKAIFGTSIKARKTVLEAIEASRADDPDVALAQLSALTLKNKLLEKWVDVASDTAVPRAGAVVTTPVAQATAAVPDAQQSLFQAQTVSEAKPGSEAGKAAAETQATVLAEVEAQATQAAQRVMARTGEPDRPVTKAEAIGIATATVAQATSDPANPKNLPASLQGLDSEQLQAALSMGKTQVVASAGSGKSHTAVARITHLVQDMGADPSKILVMVFNRKAATELKERFALKLGDAAKSMSVGTMHSLFRRFIVEYGTKEEKDAVTTWLMGAREGGGGAPSKAPSEAAMAGSMARAWKECYGQDPPKRATMTVQKWLMNDVSPADAAKNLDSYPGATQETVRWYEWWLGFKGITKNWEPPCRRTKPKADKMWGDFLAKYRDNGRARLGDFSDMILIFRDILRRDPTARKKIQGMFDHVVADECQDLNSVQHEILGYLTEHVTETNGKSAFIVGDPDQTINTHVGARTDLFNAYGSKPDWKRLEIQTNYRCLPEIVKFANQLMQDHPREQPKVANPDPRKPYGQASVVLFRPDDHTQGAVVTMARVAQDVEAGASLSDYAVLSRTNMELNDYETACIVAGIPYARRGASSFLKSPETVTVMCYMNLAVGQDFKRMQASLGQIFNKPNRFFLKAGESEAIVTKAVEARAREKNISVDQVNPIELFDPAGIQTFLRLLNASSPAPAWKLEKQREQLLEMKEGLEGMRTLVQRGEYTDATGERKPYTTQALIGDILNMRGAPESFDKPAPTLRDVLMPARTGAEEEGDDPEESAEGPIGNVAFLFKMAEAKPDSPNDPSKPMNFKAYVDKLAQDSKDLRIDMDQWDREQGAKPASERQTAPCVQLSTIHKTKGAQWPKVTLVMAEGVFPRPEHIKAKKAVEERKSTNPTDLALYREFLAERQIAYVGMTRAAQDLVVVSPGVSASGKVAKGDSVFVEEAGLHGGQNVEGKNSPLPDLTSTRPVFAFDQYMMQDSLKESSGEPTYVPETR